VMVVAALSKTPPLVYAALVAGGASWLSVMSTYNTATQTSVPPWVRARATAMHTLCALGSFAIGSAFWGAVSDLVGLTPSLLVAALAMLAGMALARPFPLRIGDAHEVTQAPLSPDLFIARQPDPEAGPVAVQINYRVREGRVDAFLEAVSQLRDPRRRDGANVWRLYRDLSDPQRYTERFLVTSWADYLHQRSRFTLADHELEARVREHLEPGSEPVVEHYIAER
jgi:hypothetical protein